MLTPDSAAGAIRSILVPLDGSDFGTRALAEAVPLARQAGGRLHLVHVRSWQSLPPDEPPAAGGDPAWRYVSGVAERVQKELGAGVSSLVIYAPDLPHEDAHPKTVIAEALRGYASENGIDLVVMTTHGHSGISRAWLGSVADTLVRAGGVPVLIVPPYPRRRGNGWGPELRLSHILIALDGSPASELAIEPAVALGGTRVRYTLFRSARPTARARDALARPSFHPDEAAVTAAKQEAILYLRAQAERLRRRRLRVEVGTSTEPIEVLATAAFAREHDVDLIALAAGGLDTETLMLAGGTAKPAGGGAGFPVLVCNGRERLDARPEADADVEPARAVLG